MVGSSDLEALELHLARLRMVVFAMALGAVGFLAISFLVASRRAPLAEAEGGPLASMPISLIALAFAAIQLGASAVLPRLAVVRDLQRISEGSFRLSGPGAERTFGPLVERIGDAGRLFALYQTRTLVASVLIEGAALFLAMAYLLERRPFTLAAAALLIGVLLLRLPTREGMRAWMERGLGQRRDP